MTVWGGRRTAPEDRPGALDMSVAEAARVLGISRALAYDLVGSRELPSFRMGGRIRIPRRGVERFTGARDDEDLGDGGAAAVWVLSAEGRRKLAEAGGASCAGTTR